MESSPGQGQAECPTCSTDTSWQLRELLQRYEKLQELVHSFMSQQPVGKMMKPMPRRTQVGRCCLGRLGRGLVDHCGWVFFAVTWRSPSLPP